MPDSLKHDPFKLVLLLTLGMAATVLTALGFEHIGGYIPCALCLKQRIPYYSAVPVGIVALIALRMNIPKLASQGLIVIIALLMAWSLGLGIYHSGVEWAFWAGPVDCAAAAGNATTTNAGDLLNQLKNTHPPSCDKAAGRFLGLSFAGWNVLASILWIAVACLALKATKSANSSNL